MTDHRVGPLDSGATSSGLLQRSLANDPAAWVRLVELYGPLVYGWCRKWGLQPFDAENVGQEAFLKVSRGLKRFRRDRPGDTFRGWLYRISRNCYVDWLRQQQTAAMGTGGSDAHLRWQDVPEEPPPGETLGERAHLYRKAVEFIEREFSARDWQVFRAVVMDGRLPNDVATELAVTPNVVYLATSRIRSRLREEFADLLPDLPNENGA